jgi:hypothetical protein
MSFERLGSLQKQRRDETELEQQQIGASERLTDTQEQGKLNSFANRGLAPPASPIKLPLRSKVEPMESRTESPDRRSGGATTPVSDNEMLAKAIQMMAASIEQSRNQTPPIYAPQLPPYPAESVPTFDGSNVTAFLERYEDMATYHSFTNKMMIECLTAHCKGK